MQGAFLPGHHGGGLRASATSWQVWPALEPRPPVMQCTDFRVVFGALASDPTQLWSSEDTARLNTREAVGKRGAEGGTSGHGFQLRRGHEKAWGEGCEAGGPCSIAVSTEGPWG